MLKLPPKRIARAGLPRAQPEAPLKLAWCHWLWWLVKAGPDLLGPAPLSVRSLVRQRHVTEAAAERPCVFVNKPALVES